MNIQTVIGASLLALFIVGLLGCLALCTIGALWEIGDTLKKIRSGVESKRND